MDTASNATDNHTSYETDRSEPEIQTRGKRRRLDLSRAKPIYNDGYRQLLNAAVADAAAGTVYESGHPLPPNYVGASLWTAIEKEHFFNALSRCGKDNIHGIATCIGTKTEVEVRAYLLLLQEGTLEKHLVEPRRQMLSYANLPAALEISQDCCDVLEQAADALDMRQRRFEISAEKEKWQGLWLLTQDVGAWVEEHMSKSEESQEEVVEVIPEAELLKLKTWLELSERIFMNPAASREHENWRSFATEGGETPSIRYTAFADFHTLAVSITRRLVQATLFFAMSRQRSTVSKIFGSKPLVTAKDARAAIKVLGLEPDSKEIWRGVGRRCGLQIYRRISELRKEGGPGPLSYEEVEAMLGGGKKSGPTTTGRAPNFASSVSDVSISEDSGEDVTLEPPPRPSQRANSSDSWGSDESEPDSGASINTVLQPSDAAETSPSETDTSPPKRPKTGESPPIVSHDSEDLYAAALDYRASLLEEKSLWDLLDQTPPFPLNPEEVELPPRPRCLRKRREELVDWRDRVEYRAVWETVGHVVAGKEEFLRPGMKAEGEEDGSAESSDGHS